jgi:hypothetical protein
MIRRFAHFTEGEREVYVVGYRTLRVSREDVMLSRYERRRLQEIERWFEENDPRFAESVKHPPPDRATSRRRWAAIAVALLGALVFLTGLLAASPGLIFVGISLGVGGIAVRYLLLNAHP